MNKNFNIETSKFSFCIMNPPYGSKRSGLGGDIHYRFVDKCSQFSKKQLVIMPFKIVYDTTEDKTRKYYKELFDKSLISVEEIISSVFDDTHMPNVGIFYFNNNKNNNNISIKELNSDEYNIVLPKFEMYRGYLYTDSPTCFIDYRKKVCEENLAPYFIEFMRLQGAFMMCHQITGDTQLEQALYAKAQQAFIDAQAADNLQKPIKVIDCGVFADVRNW